MKGFDINKVTFFSYQKFIILNKTWEIHGKTQVRDIIQNKNSYSSKNINVKERKLINFQIKGGKMLYVTLDFNLGPAGLKCYT